MLLSIGFAEFTGIFYGLMTLIGLGIVFEKKIITLEDHFDEWWESERKERKNATKKKRENT